MWTSWRRCYRKPWRDRCGQDEEEKSEDRLNTKEG
jgi:hypothetical protein